MFSHLAVVDCQDRGPLFGEGAVLEGFSRLGLFEYGAHEAGTHERQVTLELVDLPGRWREVKVVLEKIEQDSLTCGRHGA